MLACVALRYNHVRRAFQESSEEYDASKVALLLEGVSGPGAT